MTTDFLERDFVLAFVVALFSESKKRRIKEGADGLALEAAKRTVDIERSHIVGILKSVSGGAFYWREQDYDALAAEVARFAKANPLYKKAVTQWLREYRSELFAVEQFRIPVEDYDGSKPTFSLYDEHPMQTFNKALDLIEFEGSRDKNTFLLKLNLTNLARVGHAMLDRAEWDGELLTTAPHVASEVRQ